MAQQTPFVDGNPSTSTSLARTVEDKIRNIIPGASKIFSLVARGKVKGGDATETKGMINKKLADTERVEAFTHTPPDVYKTCSGGSGLEPTFASVADMHVRMMFKNTITDEVGYIDKISGTTVTFIAISSSFSATTDQVLLSLGNNYEDGSSDPAYVQNADSQIYNVMGITRWPTAITRSADSSKHLAGGDFFKRMKRIKHIEALRAIDRSFIWSERAASGNKTVMTTLGVSVRTGRGLWNYAQNEFDAHGNMTPSKLRKDLILSMDSSIENEVPMLVFTSRENCAQAQEWVQDKLLYTNPKGGMVEKVGIKSDTYRTSGPDLKLIAHDAFEYGADTGKALIFAPDYVQYRFKKGFDLHPRENIQSNSLDGYIDEITGEFCLLPLFGGYRITKVINWS